MKEHMNWKNCSIILFLLIIIFIISFIIIPLTCGYNLGFLDGYSTDLEHIYYISCIFAPIIIAIWIPTKIADRQDKIALFEKRYDLYLEILDLQQFQKSIEDNKNADIIGEFVYSMQHSKDKPDETMMCIRRQKRLVDKTQQKINQITILYKKLSIASIEYVLKDVTVAIEKQQCDGKNGSKKECTHRSCKYLKTNQTELIQTTLPLKAALTKVIEEMEKQLELSKEGHS